MNESSVEDYLDTLMAARPPLTDVQRDRLRFLLNGRRPVYTDVRRELQFREFQAAQGRRRDSARRLPPLDDGRRDPLDTAC